MSELTNKLLFDSNSGTQRPVPGMRTGRKAAFAIGLAFAALTTGVPSFAQDPAEPNQFIVGFEERVRTDDWNNAGDMTDKTNDQRDQFRYRTRVWFNVPVAPTVNMVVGIAEESIYRFAAVNKPDEVYFDQAYLNFRKVFVKGLAFKFGRQDIFRGEGFILSDGTPGDGPRNSYYNAANLSYSFRKQKIELLGIFDPAHDQFFPRIHDQNRVLQNWDEQALGAYYTNADHPKTTIESYFFYKKEVNDILSIKSPLFQPDRHVNTLGGRVVQKLSKRTDWTSEYARQWGAQHGGASISAWGGYSYVKHIFDRQLRPYVKAGYWAMSGDDPRTPNKIEGWDPLFSQYPKWSDIYVSALAKEKGPAYWTNLRFSQVEAGFAPSKSTNLGFIWYHMNSFHPFAGTHAIFGTGTSRGENFQARFEYHPNPSWKAYIHYENHHPGDFYSANRAPAYQVQALVAYSFNYRPFGKWFN